MTGMAKSSSISMPVSPADSPSPAAALVPQGCLQPLGWHCLWSALVPGTWKDRMLVCTTEHALGLRTLPFRTAGTDLSYQKNPHKTNKQTKKTDQGPGYVNILPNLHVIPIQSAFLHYQALGLWQILVWVPVCNSYMRETAEQEFQISS